MEVRAIRESIIFFCFAVVILYSGVKLIEFGEFIIGITLVISAVAALWGVFNKPDAFDIEKRKKFLSDLISRPHRLSYEEYELLRTLQDNDHL